MSNTLGNKDLSQSEEEQYELQDGDPDQIKSVSVAHATIRIKLARMLDTFLDGKTWKLLLGVPAYLFDGKEDVPAEYKRPVQPDLMVVCDRSKLDAKSCKGAPDLVIEVLSPSNRENDEIRKFDLYERAGVREYWMVDQKPRRVYVCLREGDGFSNVVHMYREKDKLPVSVLPGCVIDLEQVFADL